MFIKLWVPKFFSKHFEEERSYEYISKGVNTLPLLVGMFGHSRPSKER